MKSVSFTCPNASGGQGAKPSPRMQRLVQHVHGPPKPANGSSKTSPTAAAFPAGSKPDADARAGVKARLRQLVTKVNAAALPGPSDLAALDAVIAHLCSINPIPDSATSDAINGRWALLYTASLSTLRRASAEVSSSVDPRQGTPGKSSGNSSSSDSQGAKGVGGGLEAVLSPLQLANDMAYRFFYTYVPVLAGAAVGVTGASSSGLVKARGNSQVFDTRAGRVENQARFEVAGRRCCINVNGTAEVVQAGFAGGPRQRLRAVFKSFDLLVEGERRLSLPLSVLNPVGYVDTPYLDDELRISIGDKGSVFIAARDQSGDL